MTKAGGSVLRAWLVAHRAVPAYVAMLGLGLVTGIWSEVLVPTLGLRDPLPMWALMPCLVALAASTSVEHQLVVLPVNPPHLRAARAAWLTTTTACGAVAALPGALVTHYPGLVGTTAFLVMLTFAVSPLLGRASGVVGAGLATLLVVHTPELSGWGPEALELIPGWVVTLTMAVCAGGGLAYALVGPRSAGPPSP